MLGCQAPAADPSRPPWSSSFVVPDGLSPDEALFRWDFVHEIRFAVTGAELRKLLNRPRDYALSTMSFDGVEVQVGLRVKGASTFQPITDKPSLKVKLDHVVDGYSLFGVEGFNLHNQVADASYIGEHLGYRIMRDMGIPSQRTGLAAVWIGRQYKGLYTITERKDKDWIRRWYDDPTGSLYEGVGCDLNGERSWGDPDEPCWEVDTVGVNDSEADLQALVLAMNANGAPSWQDVRAELDTDVVTRGLAAEWVLGHWDSYSGNLNNLHLYHEPSSGKWSLSPWSMDLAFGRPVEGDCDQTPTNRGAFQVGLLARLCRDATTCDEQVVDAAREALDRIDDLDVDTTVQSLRALMEPWIATELDASARARWRGQVNCARGYMRGRRAALRL